MEFVLVTIGMVGFIILVLVLVARAYPGSGADLLDWKPTRDYETEIQLESDDISQMIAAQNAYRRKRGAEEMTEADAEEMAREDNRIRERGQLGGVEEMAELEREVRQSRNRVEKEDAGESR